MKILVTGSTGFVGRNLLPKLIDSGHDIAEVTIEPAVSRKLYGNHTLKIEVSEKQIDFKSQIEEFNPNIVIHLASLLTSADDYDTLVKLLNVNIRFFCRLLDALKKCDLMLFVNTGTFAEYFKGDGVLSPAYLYSATKTATRSFLDYYSRAYSFKQVTVVPYTIYGAKDTQKKIIDIIINSLNAETPTDLSPGEQVLDFIYVDDVANFYIQLIKDIDKIANNASFPLGTGKGTTLRKLVKIIEKETGKRANINWGGEDYRPSDVMYAVANMSNYFHQFGWRPKITLEKGVKKFLKLHQVQ